MSHLDTIINNVHYLFNANKWNCTKTSHKVIFTNKQVPLDEISVEIPQPTEYYNTIQVSIPVKTVNYLKTFMNINDAINYVKMHTEIYENRAQTQAQA